MTYWFVFKNEYKKIIFWTFCFSVAWLFPSWCAGKPISIGDIISTLVGFFGGLLITSYAIHVGWATEVICPEEQLALQKIRHLAKRCKNKLQTIFEWKLQ